MSNQFLNPIIHFHPTDTLNCCSICLSYLMESLDSLPLEETSRLAQQGLHVFIDCVRQAIDFESDRAEVIPELPQPKQRLSELEKLLMQQMLKILEKADSGSNDTIIVPPSGPKTDH